MKTRYVETNSNGLILQYKNITYGWRDVKYLETEVRDSEKEMNKLIDKISKLVEKRNAALDKIDDARKEIKGSGDALKNTSNTRLEPISFSSWLGSYFTAPLTVKQKDSWKPVAEFLKKKSYVKTSANRMTQMMTPLATQTLVPSPQRQRNNGKGNQNNGNNNQKNN